MLTQCPILRPPQTLTPDGEYEVEVDEFDVVILSQSCDLTHAGKITNVLVCPYYPFRQYAEEKARKEGSNLTAKAVTNFYEELRKGQQPNFHLLNPPSAPGGDYFVVDFRNVYAVHFLFLQQYVSSLLTPRPRLLPPYREHLAQALARFFMRVGLPQDLPRLSAEQAAAYVVPRP